MRKRRIVIAVAVAGVVAVGTGGAIALANGDPEEHVTGPAAERAARAALELAGGGTVGGVEREDEGAGAWEVEVTDPTGRSIEVVLDEGYGLVRLEQEGSGDGTTTDDEGAEPEEDVDR